MDYINSYFFELDLGYVISMFTLKMVMAFGPFFAFGILFSNWNDMIEHGENRYSSNNLVDWLQLKDSYYFKFTLSIVLFMVSIFVCLFYIQYVNYVKKMSYDDIIEYGNSNKQYSLIAKNICIPKNIRLKNNQEKFVSKTIHCIQVHNFW